MVTWNTLSPRVGGNVRLTERRQDRRCAAVAGRYYLPLFLGEFEDLHPGRAVRDLYRYDPATSGYTTFVSRTDPRTQFRIDPNMKAPYTDQFSIGVDRELAKNLGVGVNFVRKNGGNELGWVDTGGVYGTQRRGDQRSEHHACSRCSMPRRRAVPANERARLLQPLHGRHPDRHAAPREPVAVHCRLHSPEGRGARAEMRRGLAPTGTDAEGRDPNDYINLEGRLGARDRPNMVSLMGVVRDSEDRGAAVGEPDRRVGNRDLPRRRTWRCRRERGRSTSSRRDRSTARQWKSSCTSGSPRCCSGMAPAASR